MKERVYRILIDELKKDISTLLLKHEAFTVSDISAILEYSKLAAFVRVFNKWHGMSPSQYEKHF